MQLHRTTGQPDWADIKPAQRNRWQRLAAATNGVITPANAVTVIGLVLVVYGLIKIGRGSYWVGLIAVAIGRLLDVVDGWLAQSTATKSPLGEIMDATVDKIGTFLTLIVFLTSGIGPRWIIVAVATPHILISIIVLVGRSRNVRLHPSRLGKLSMALLWVVLPGYVIVKALSAGTGWEAAVDSLAIASTIMGLIAAYRYAFVRD